MCDSRVRVDKPRREEHAFRITLTLLLHILCTIITMRRCKYLCLSEGTLKLCCDLHRVGYVLLQKLFYGWFFFFFITYLSVRLLCPIVVNNLKWPCVHISIVLFANDKNITVINIDDFVNIYEINFSYI